MLVESPWAAQWLAAKTEILSNKKRKRSLKSTPPEKNRWKTTAMPSKPVAVRSLVEAAEIARPSVTAAIQARYRVSSTKGADGMLWPWKVSTPIRKLGARTPTKTARITHLEKR